MSTHGRPPRSSPPLDSVPERRRRAGLSRVAKRVIDVVGAATGLVLLFPLMLVIVLLIRLTSDGPVLFRQLRRGYQGQPFLLFKFRTMVADAEDQLEALETRNEM